MIDISMLEEYFPKLNKLIVHGKYTFTIMLNQDEETFVLNLRVEQQDAKEEHLIKFRFGMGKDSPQEHACHETDQPHFEVDLYKRGEETFSATLYFTFRDAADEQIMNYAKGTVVLIDKILKDFIKRKRLDEDLISELVYDEEVLSELGVFEETLLDALYQCYKHSDLIVRQDGQTFTVKTPHNLKKFLGSDDLSPLYRPLLKRINNE